MNKPNQTQTSIQFSAFFCGTSHSQTPLYLDRHQLINLSSLVTLHNSPTQKDTSAILMYSPYKY